MGERGNIKNLWKSFRIFLRQQKKKKDEEEEIIRRKKKKTKIKNTFKLSFYIFITAFFHLVFYLIPKKEENKKLTVKVKNIKMLNKFENTKEKVNKADTLDELKECKNELIEIDKKVSESEEKFKTEIKTEIIKVDERIDEKSNVKKDTSIDLGRLIVPVLAVSEEIITKPIEEKKQEKIQTKKIKETKDELSEAIKYINKQLELQKEIVSIKKKPSKINFFTKMIKDVFSTSLVTGLLFKNPVITLFTDAVVVNNNVRTMRKKLNKDVNYIDISNMDKLNAKKNEIERYTDKVLSNSLYQINMFKDEILEKYGNQISYNDELKEVLKEIENITSYVEEQKEIINKKTKNMIKK